MFIQQGFWSWLREARRSIQPGPGVWQSNEADICVLVETGGLSGSGACLPVSFVYKDGKQPFFFFFFIRPNEMFVKSFETLLINACV